MGKGSDIWLAMLVTEDTGVFVTKSYQGTQNRTKEHIKKTT